MVQHIEQLREDVRACAAVMLAAIVKDHDVTRDAPVAVLPHSE